MEVEHILKSAEAKKLYRTILKLKNEKEIANFLRDLCTIEELSEMIKRWQAARMINDRRPYRHIAKKTGVSTTTVSRVAYWLNHGTGGYKTALKKLR